MKRTIALSAMLFAATAPAHADWRGRGGGYGGEWHEHHHHESGVAGAILGLGAAAIIGGALLGQGSEYYAPAYPQTYYVPPPPPCGYYPYGPCYYQPRPYYGYPGY